MRSSCVRSVVAVNMCDKLFQARVWSVVLKPSYRACTVCLKTDEVHSAQVKRSPACQTRSFLECFRLMHIRPGLGENRCALRQSDVNLTHSDAINCNCVGFSKTFRGQEVCIFFGECY